MARTQTQEASAVGHDSFLDVVTNMVGILIILTLVVGLRIKNAPAKVTPNEAMLQTAESLEKDQSTEIGLRREIEDTSNQIASIAREAMLRGRERDLLAIAIKAAERKIDDRRGDLNGDAKQDFDLRRQLQEMRAKLEDLEREKARATSDPGESVVIENYPTPVAKTVFGEEAHFQLRGGRIAYVPLNRLETLAKSDARSKADRLVEKGVPEVTETIGPEGGFRLRYSVRRYDEIEKTPNGAVRHCGLQFTRWTIIPVTPQLGEPVEEALKENSDFRRALASLRPETSITIWVYEDSFGSFRSLRKELYHLGRLVAARPLPDQVLISGAPGGSRSEAE